jgi:hypothetical protein
MGVNDVSVKHSALGRVLASVAIIALVAALGVGATIAYFSGTQDRTATIATATIGVNSEGLPYTFPNMLPGETQSRNVNVKNESTAQGDLFVQMLGTPSPSGEANFCQPDPVLWIAIYNLDTSSYVYSGWICNLYPGHDGSTIPKLADDVGAGGWAHLRVDLTLSTEAGNEYQNKSNTDTVHFIAVQYNGPAPIANKQGFGSGAYAEGWPTDNYAPDDDTNYP